MTTWRRGGWHTRRVEEGSKMKLEERTKMNG